MPDYGYELAFGTFFTPQHQWPECLSTTRQLVTS
jgi:hypothetical protein